MANGCCLPAQLIQANDIGKIEAGYKANLVIFNETFEVQQVITEEIFLINGFRK